MTRKSDPQRPRPASMTFEAATEELEAIIDRIEQGEIGLQESLAERRRGEALIKRCREVLDKAEQELSEISPPEVEGGTMDSSDA